MDLNDIKTTAVKRRKLLVTGAVGGAAVLFGVSLFESPSTTDPVVPEARLDGWQRVSEADRTATLTAVGPVEVRLARSTLQYEYRALGRQVRQRPVEFSSGGETQSNPLGTYVGDGFGNELMTASASRIDMSPDLNNLPLGVGRAEILDAVVDRATETFESQLESAGVNRVRRTGRGRLQADTGETAELVEYAGRIPFDGFTVRTLGTSVTFPPDTLNVAGKLAIWNHGDYVVVTTGTYPAANYSAEVTETTDDGREVTVSVDLGLAPARHERTVTDLMAAVR